MILEPGKGTFRLHFDTTSVPLISVLKAMQVPEKDIKATFGDLYPSNVKIDNPANVGSIVRNAAALGWDALVLDHTSADPLARRALRVAMGTAFSLPHARTTQLVDQLLGLVVAMLKAGLPDRLVQLAGFVLRSHLSRLIDGWGTLHTQAPWRQAGAAAAADPAPPPPPRKAARARKAKAA